MLPPRRSDRNDYSELKEANQEPDRESTRPEEIRRPTWDGQGDRASEEAAANRLDRYNKAVQQQEFEKRKEAEPAPEKKPEIEQKIDEGRPAAEDSHHSANEHRPEESREEPRTADAERAGEAKKAEEQEFDMKRFMSDPDYRRQMKEQRQAEQSERTESREQEAERVATSGRQL